MNHYYLAASLPTLSMESAPPLDFPKFRALCGEHLSEADLAELDALVAGAGANGRFGRVWRNLETQLRNTAARIRAGRLKQDVSGFLRDQDGVDVRLTKWVEDAFGRPHPLDREAALDRIRWVLLDEVAGFNMFSADAIFAYALKLKIAERWAGLDAGKGKARVDELASRRPAEMETI